MGFECLMISGPDQGPSKKQITLKLGNLGDSAVHHYQLKTRRNEERKWQLEVRGRELQERPQCRSYGPDWGQPAWGRVGRINNSNSLSSLPLIS